MYKIPEQSSVVWQSVLTEWLPTRDQRYRILTKYFA
ncbi:uncharacterized protein FIBRA_09598 [Fibroporia radiculosa]|uniref:Uncharacterized protein n=1 Tax=Fibroporia radiculosa TaxID=599839 RepID=J7RI49_9APHY|nr:uncharacterized protein FIBRA_09598 [Fibroporia radiculosa]CCM07252.1 predicted protein [Fibroporia radiculosa]